MSDGLQNFIQNYNFCFIKNDDTKKNWILKGETLRDDKKT